MGKKTTTKAIIRRFFVFFVCTAVIIAGSVLISNSGPRQYQYRNDSFDFDFVPPAGWSEFAGNHTFMLDQHSHTLYSDGRMTVEQNVLWHIKQGFNVTFITDHNTIKHLEDTKAMAKKYADQILVMFGMEYTTRRIHMNFLGISEWDFNKFPIPQFPTDTQMQEAITEVHRQGGVVVVNHIPWSLRVGMTTHPSRADLLSWGVDFIEVINEHEYDYDSDPWINATAGFGAISGTDVHSPDKVKGWTGLNLTEFTEEAVMTALKNKATAIFFSEIGSPDASKSFENPAYIALKPFMYVGDMFERFYINGNLDWVGIAIFVGYIFGFYVIFEVVRIKGQKIPKDE
jgi:predicted metal-dependent phosphoesterase TrpH